MAAKNDAADLATEIDALRRMTVKELRRRHIELFGEETRAGNRQYLFRRIAWRVQALAEGDLTERARRRAQELARDADLRRRPPRELAMPPAPGNLKTVTGRIAMSRGDPVLRLCVSIALVRHRGAVARHADQRQLRGFLRLALGAQRSGPPVEGRPAGIQPTCFAIGSRLASDACC